jgi:hypothetical protein
MTPSLFEVSSGSSEISTAWTQPGFRSITGCNRWCQYIVRKCGLRTWWLKAECASSAKLVYKCASARMTQTTTMASYFLSWLSSGTSAIVEPTLSEPIPEISETSPPSDDEGSETEREDDDRPPAFPALFSAQRASSGITLILTDTDMMPPPPLPGLARRQPGVPLSSSLAPPATTKRPPKVSTKSRKVALAPGHSALDWANLRTTDLRVSANLSQPFLYNQEKIGRRYPDANTAVRVEAT